MPNKIMPRIYLWLLLASAVTYLTIGLIDGRADLWGPVERIVMLVAGVLVAVAALRAGSASRVAAYFAGVGGLFQVAAYFMNWVQGGEVYALRSAVVWFTFTTYTVLLLAFGWVSRGPE